MKSKTHTMAEAITLALGPIFHAQPDYKTICEAMALTVARVAQSTPDKGDEIRQLDKIHDMAFIALQEYLNEEEALLETRQKTIAKGIDGFNEMARDPRDESDLKDYYQDRITLADMAARKERRKAEAFAEMVPSDGGNETEVSHEEFYRNSGLDPKLYEFDNGLAAINGGVSPEACAEAEEFAGQDHDQWGDGGPMAAKHLDPKDDELESPEYNEGSWSPDHERVGWANSSIHEEVARFEREHPELDPSSNPDTYNPDGPRAYAP